jgi:hypothetical protein
MRPATSAPTSPTGTTETGTTPKLFAKSVQTARPVITPTGIPTRLPNTATVVASQPAFHRRTGTTSGRRSVAIGAAIQIAIVRHDVSPKAAATHKSTVILSANPPQ